MPSPKTPQGQRKDAIRGQDLTTDGCSHALGHPPSAAPFDSQITQAAISLRSIGSRMVTCQIGIPNENPIADLSWRLHFKQGDRA
jgi:hypothetical protein